MKTGAPTAIRLTGEDADIVRKLESLTGQEGLTAVFRLSIREALERRLAMQRFSGVVEAVTPDYVYVQVKHEGEKKSVYVPRADCRAEVGSLRRGDGVDLQRNGAGMLIAMRDQDLTLTHRQVLQALDEAREKPMPTKTIAFKLGKHDGKGLAKLVSELEESGYVTRLEGGVRPTLKGQGAI